MDLLHAKELEDLKFKLEETKKNRSDVFAPYYQKHHQKRKEIIDSIIDDFTKYFTKNSFALSNEKNVIRAKYKTLEIILTYPESNISSLGGFIVCSLTYENKRHMLFIKKEGEKYTQGGTIIVETNFNNKIDEIAKLKMEIDKLNMDLNNIDKLMQELDNIKIYFELCDDKNHNLFPKEKINSFEELLNLAFKN